MPQNGGVRALIRSACIGIYQTLSLQVALESDCVWLSFDELYVDVTKGLRRSCALASRSHPALGRGYWEMGSSQSSAPSRMPALSFRDRDAKPPAPTFSSHQPGGLASHAVRLQQCELLSFLRPQLL